MRPAEKRPANNTPGRVFASYGAQKLHQQFHLTYIEALLMYGHAYPEKAIPLCGVLLSHFWGEPHALIGGSLAEIAETFFTSKGRQLPQTRGHDPITCRQLEARDSETSPPVSPPKQRAWPLPAKPLILLVEPNGIEPLTSTMPL